MQGTVLWIPKGAFCPLEGGGGPRHIGTSLTNTSEWSMSWQFLTYSHQSRDKSTLSLLKGLFSAEKVNSHTDTSFCRMRRRGRALLRLIFTHSRLLGYNRAQYFSLLGIPEKALHFIHIRSA